MFTAVTLICSLQRACRGRPCRSCEQKPILSPCSFLPHPQAASDRSYLIARWYLPSQQPGSLIHEHALSTRCCVAPRSHIHVQLLRVRTKEFRGDGIGLDDNMAAFNNSLGVEVRFEVGSGARRVQANRIQVVTLTTASKVPF